MFQLNKIYLILPVSSSHFEVTSIFKLWLWQC